TSSPGAGCTLSRGGSAAHTGIAAANTATAQRRGIGGISPAGLEVERADAEGRPGGGFDAVYLRPPARASRNVNRPAAGRRHQPVTGMAFTGVSRQNTPRTGPIDFGAKGLHHVHERGAV